MAEKAFVTKLFAKSRDGETTTPYDVFVGAFGVDVGCQRLPSIDIEAVWELFNEPLERPTELTFKMKACSLKMADVLSREAVIDLWLAATKTTCTEEFRKNLLAAKDDAYFCFLPTGRFGHRYSPIDEQISFRQFVELCEQLAQESPPAPYHAYCYRSISMQIYPRNKIVCTGPYGETVEFGYGLADSVYRRFKDARQAARRDADLHLTHDQAVSLMAVLNRVGGCPSTSRRRECDAIRKLVLDASETAYEEGVQIYESLGGIRFYSRGETVDECCVSLRVDDIPLLEPVLREAVETRNGEGPLCDVLHDVLQQLRSHKRHCKRMTESA